MAQLQSTSITGSLIVTGGITGSISGSIVSPGSTTQVLYNNGGVVAGSSGFVYSGSYVGIGTTNPSNKVHINSTDDDAYALRVQGNTNNVSGVWTGIGLAGEGSNTKVGILFEDVGVSYSRGKLIFAVNNAADQTNATPANAVMTLIPGGNVGIGTTSPAYKLDVDSGATTIAARFYSPSNDSTVVYIGGTANTGFSDLVLYSNSGTGEIFKAGTGYTSYGGALALNIFNSNGAIALHPNSVSNVMFITGSNGGSVWVGNTTDYGARFSVKQPSSGNAANFSNGVDADLTIEITATGAATKYAKLSPSVAIPLVLATTAGSNVGIGTTTPGAKLDVNGTTYLASQVLINGTTNSNTSYMYDANGGSYYQAPPALIRLDSASSGSIEEAPVALFIHNENGSNNTWTKLSLGSRETAGSGNSVSVAGIAAQKTSGTSNSWASGDLYLWTKNGGSQVANMVLKPSGYVGIGTTSPGTKLTVAGSDDAAGTGVIEIQTAGGTNLKIGGDTSYSWIQSHAAKPLYINQLGNNVIFNSGGGNVGIGTTSPGARLTVQTSTASSSDSLRITDGTGIINIGHWDAVTNRFEFSGKPTYFIQYGTGNYISFGTLGSENMRIEAGGNVGIGTSSPGYKLDVNGNTNITGNLFFNSNSTLQAARRYVSTAALSNAGYTVIGTVTGDALASSVRISLQGTANSVVINVMADILVNHYQDILITSYAGIYTLLTLRVISNNNELYSIEATTNSANACTTYVEIFPLNNETVVFGGSAQTGTSLTHVCVPGINVSATGGSNGNLAVNGDVGIGTTSPNYKLDVSGSGRFTGGLNLTSENPQLTFTDTTSGEDDMTLNMNGDYLEFLSNTTRNILTVQGETSAYAGRVGIGTSSPGYKLHVAGNAYINETLYVNQATTVEDTFTVKTATGAYDVAVIDYSGVAGGRIKVYTDGILRSQIGSYYGDDTFFNAGYGGNVGIGTSTPSTPLGGAMGLVIDGNTNGDVQIRIQANSTGRTSTDGGLLSISGTAMYLWNYENDALYFGTNNTARVTITSAGNVGIGTTTPSQKLEVSGGDALIRTAYIGNISAYGTSYASFSHTSRAGAGEYSFLSGNAGETYINAKTSNPIYFRINNIDKVIINDAGYVGIGTTTPSVELDVNGSVATNAVIFKNSGGGNTLGYYEENTWTPSIETVNNDIGTVNYSGEPIASYTRIGNVVHTWFTVDISSIGGIGTGTGKITGLPYTAASNGAPFTAVILDGSVILSGAAGRQLKGYIDQGSDYITLYLFNSGTSGYGPIANALWDATGGIISGYVSYQV
jgi:hypothetical protein